MKQPGLLKIYEILLETYTLQGWWPVFSCRNRKTRGVVFDRKGYHHGDYSFPRTAAEKYEIAVGAILTQNTAWTNVQQVIVLLQEADMLSPGSFVKSAQEKTAEKIRPSGYFNQKAKKLHAFDTAWRKGNWGNPRSAPSREELLSVWGIGEETADSMLLYAFHRPVFVVDAYTKRIFSRLGCISGKEKYSQIQVLFEKALPESEPLFNEYHALIVEHAKVSCGTKPACPTCCLLRYCRYAHAGTQKN